MVALVITGAAFSRVIVPPLAVMVSDEAFEDAPIALLTDIESDVLAVPAAIVAVTMATRPLLIVLEFIPLAIQVTNPVPEAQVSVLLAEVSAAPAVTLREVISLEG